MGKEWMDMEFQEWICQSQYNRQCAGGGGGGGEAIALTFLIIVA